jgi:hypothetical protein
MIDGRHQALEASRHPNRNSYAALGSSPDTSPKSFS